MAWKQDRRKSRSRAGGPLWLPEQEGGEFLDYYEQAILAALEGRFSILAKLHEPPRTVRQQRDEIIEALATKTTRYDHVGGRSSGAHDALMADLVDGKIDRTLAQSQGADHDERQQLEALQGVVRSIDRLRHRLPLHQGAVIDALYYQEMKAGEAAKRLHMSTAQLQETRLAAIRALAATLRGGK